MQGEQDKRVLVVDDDDDIRGMIETALRRRGLVVDQARNGDEALSRLQEQPYSVVILDLLMPGRDGFGVLEGLETLALPFAPVVLVVTAADRKTADRLDPRRIHGVVRKPFDPIDLAAVVAACAEVRGRGPMETMALATILGGRILEILN